MKKLFCCPALELFHCLLLWKTGLFVSSSAFSLSTPTFSMSTPVENSEAAWKKSYKMQQKVNIVEQKFFGGQNGFETVTGLKKGTVAKWNLLLYKTNSTIN